MDIGVLNSFWCYSSSFLGASDGESTLGLDVGRKVFEDIVVPMIYEELNVVITNHYGRSVCEKIPLSPCWMKAQGDLPLTGEGLGVN